MTASTPLRPKPTGTAAAPDDAAASARAELPRAGNTGDLIIEGTCRTGQGAMPGMVPEGGVTAAPSCRVNDRLGHAAGGMPQHGVRRVGVMGQQALAGVVSRRGLPANRTSPASRPPRPCWPDRRCRPGHAFNPNNPNNPRNPACRTSSFPARSS